MLLAWKAVGIWTYAGYILGFPNDTPESARRDIEIIKKEMPLDVLEFFFLTPLPGSEDHKVLWTKGAALDPAPAARGRDSRATMGNRLPPPWECPAQWAIA